MRSTATTQVEEAWAAANRVVDPCSSAADVPLGIVDMGVISKLAIEDDVVLVELRPTFYGCLFVGFFEEELRQAIGTLRWCQGVKVSLARDGVIWTEELMTPAGRERLSHRRRAALGSSRRHAAQEQSGQ
jgi:ring-1,2-phenylacetyl-CoA epoxidase subunit PaaD